MALNLIIRSSRIPAPLLTPAATPLATPLATSSISTTSRAVVSSSPETTQSSPSDGRGIKRTCDSINSDDDPFANKENQNLNSADDTQSTYRKKKKSKHANKDLSEIERGWGHILARLFDASSSPSAMMNMGVKYENAEAEEQDMTQFTPEQVHLIQGYKGVINHLPALDAIITAIANAKDPKKSQELLQSLYTNLSSGQDSSRSDDNAVLKIQIIKMIQTHRQLHNGAADLKENAKDTRGFHNAFTRYLLTGPDTDFSNTKLVADMQANKWQADPEDLVVRYLYANFEIDSDDIYTGCLRSDLLVWAYKSIFFGPSSWQGGFFKNRRPCKASLCNLKNVTGRSIAYIATLLVPLSIRIPPQVRCALSSEESLQKEGGSFNCPKFFATIVNLFEDEELTEEAKETLQWWQT
ncbi:hypothetical protein M422DRAFT_53329 [Sphaerobolus stellatus SS14]|uniref:Uncharacterized protein n=1 Tax=Sphaerobolus stellatus (strain SS14) TaxID=990650 RepID=A0A0C9UR25_SPHS4|nr:hypothetical protein M422DRAFT_53329 [Sphaerobolus stellatus SS14]